MPFKLSSKIYTGFPKVVVRRKSCASPKASDTHTRTPKEEEEEEEEEEEASNLKSRPSRDSTRLTLGESAAESMSAPAPDAAAPAGAPGAPGAPGADGAPGTGPPAPPPNTSSNRRLQQTQAQVEEVVDIMRVNVDKVLERDQKLSELDDRADALQAGASQFESCAAKLKNKYWWKNCKMMIMMGIIGVIVVGIIFLYFFS
ncbi:hypothetical protein KOW79_000739 [Hemibagrus wyckioides]|uniref:V-SNARE coiled-coil homology domain-containing protein n=2 Tax=Hemibagrus wyckioides TaxID=337641 RepID=A0A9D3P8L2_9TELE|nr:hypothetical protein KOW79_000739 [Hemibagrus wyckioides]